MSEDEAKKKTAEADPSGPASASIELAEIAKTAIVNGNGLEEFAKASRATTVNINMVFNAVSQHQEDPAKWAETMTTILDVTKKAQDQELNFFERQAAAIITAKTNDPELIDKRANSQSRRVLRYAVAATPILAISSAVVIALVCPSDTGMWGIVAALIGLAAGAAVQATGLASGGDAPTPEQIRKLTNPQVSPVKRLDDQRAKTQPTRRKAKGGKK